MHERQVRFVSTNIKRMIREARHRHRGAPLGGRGGGYGANCKETA